MSNQRLDRQRGTLIGLAIGDTLGAAVEFQPLGSFELVIGFRDGGPHGLEPGQWTDDTSMALALADSIAKVGWNLDDQARRYVSRDPDIEVSDCSYRRQTVDGQNPTLWRA